MTEELRVPLLVEDLDALEKPINGDGGRQSLLRRLQRAVRPRPAGGFDLLISPDDVDRCLHQWTNTGGEPGAGGFQQRLPMQSLADAGLVPADVTYRPKATLGLF